MNKLPLIRNHSPHIVLAIFIIAYAGYFSWYTINRHNTLNSYMADLSLIDQPMWNTVLGPGYFMELTWGDRQQPRLAEHFEPILVPLALLFYLWDDVRILLIAQSVALALGTLPVFWVARAQFTLTNNQLSATTSHAHRLPTRPPYAKWAEWIALVFAGVYLLSPHLQAANVADFHADPFVVTPLLFAFWYATQKRWRWMWLWAIVAMSTKETLPPLAAMLGVWLLINAYRHRKTKETPAGRNGTAVNGGRSHREAAKLHRSSHRSAVNPELLHGLGLIFISTTWFLIATFLIVAPLAREYFGADGPIYLANRYRDGLTGIGALLQEPARWCYLVGLLASVGFLPLLAPELLILGLPVLAANFMSSFSGQYSGEQHYSAPLVVALIIAAIYGTRRLVDKISLRERNGQILKITFLTMVLIWLTSWSLGYHALHGWTPLSTRMEAYRLGPAAATLPDLISQVPPDTPVTASAAIHPHLAHRRVIYNFPIVAEATHMLVDVTDIPGVHPNDAQAQIVEMLDTDWQLLQADQGLILAQHSPSASTTTSLPDSFYDFARASAPPGYPTPLLFGNGDLALLGYSLHDDPDDGVVFRLFWQALKELPKDIRLWPLIYNDLGRLLVDPSLVPMIATVWYPPSAWRTDEIIVTETLPQRLPDIFHLGVAVGPENSFGDPSQRLPVTMQPDSQTILYPGNWAQLASFKRQGTFLSPLPPLPAFHPLTPTDVQFGPAIHLTGYWFETNPIDPGDTLPLLLQWRAGQQPNADYTVFVHLLAPDGALITQSDASPTRLTPAPTSQWPLEQPILDNHHLILPDKLPAGTYTLQVGLYHPQTLERLLIPDKNSFLTLGEIEVR